MPLVTRPTTILELIGQPVTQLAASKLTSAVVLAGGEVATFGDGRAGKLGHGNGENVVTPSRVGSCWRMGGRGAQGAVHVLALCGRASKLG